jgi:hypothetical protein
VSHHQIKAEIAPGVRAERDAYANRLAATERDNARLRAENARLWQIIADAFDHTLNQPEENR